MMGNFPLSLGPLDDPEYIEDITADFREEQHREPYGADELLHWHRRRINKHIASVAPDSEIGPDFRMRKTLSGAELAKLINVRPSKSNAERAEIYRTTDH
jgi:hypothetical protein